MNDRICTYCGQAGHRASSCPRRKTDDKKHAVFCAALTGLLAGTKSWTHREKEVKTPDQYTAVARHFAQEWEKQHAPRP